MDHLPDEELMRLTGGGDDAAFALIVRRHQHLVYGTIHKMLGDYAADAEDVAQVVFVKVHQAASRYRPEAKFTTWLLTICRNCVFTHLKRASRRRHESIDVESEEGGDGEFSRQEADASALGADRELLQKEMAEALQRAMGELPEQQRTALVLRQYDQLEYEEIAKVMKTSVSSVKSLLFRAREHLRERLARYLNAT